MIHAMAQPFLTRGVVFGPGVVPVDCDAVYRNGRTVRHAGHRRVPRDALMFVEACEAVRWRFYFLMNRSKLSRT